MKAKKIPKWLLLIRRLAGLPVRFTLPPIRLEYWKAGIWIDANWNRCPVHLMPLDYCLNIIQYLEKGQFWSCPIFPHLWTRIDELEHLDRQLEKQAEEEEK